MVDWKKFCEMGLAVIETEAQAVTRLADKIDSSFAKACELLLPIEGRIVVIGMGKSGHIGGKSFRPAVRYSYLYDRTH